MLRPLRLDFHPAAGRARLRLAWCAFATAAALAALLAERGAGLRDEVDGLRDRSEALAEHARPNVPGEAPPSAEQLRQIGAANQVIDALAVPWGELFQALDAAPPRGLGLLSMAPNAKDHSVRLAGEARSVPELLAFADRLSALAPLGQVHLLGYETVQREGVAVISFTMAATWQAR